MARGGDRMYEIGVHEIIVAAFTPPARRAMPPLTGRRATNALFTQTRLP